MRWSKLRSLIEERFTSSLGNRLAIHSAAYGNCSCGHCWITLDKEVIANFCTRAYFNKELYQAAEENPMYKHQLVMYGEKSRQGAYVSMFDFVHTLSIEQALESEDVLVQALAVVDSRVGKRRLAAINAEKLHPLAFRLLEIRRVAESGLEPCA
ncbi:MAG TPA: hypothetical protein VGH80_13765 [Xanthomonadaceae bacterium]|jgi:hypothetical protein